MRLCSLFLTFALVASPTLFGGQHSGFSSNKTNDQSETTYGSQVDPSTQARGQHTGFSGRIYQDVLMENADVAKKFQLNTQNHLPYDLDFSFYDVINYDSFIPYIEDVEVDEHLNLDDNIETVVTIYDLSAQIALEKYLKNGSLTLEIDGSSIHCDQMMASGSAGTILSGQDEDGNPITIILEN